MSPVTVYSKPGCPPCNATKKALKGHSIPFTEIDITQDPDALNHIISLGFNAAPVVIVGDQSWSGYRSERIKELAISRA